MAASKTLRRYKTYHVSWVVTFLPGLVLPLWGWSQLAEPEHWAGLGVMVAAGLVVIPSLVVVLLYFLPAALRGGLVPRDWRKRYRQKHGREGAHSSYISKGLRRVTFAADRYRCVGCRGRVGVHIASLEWDHTMPWSLGGLTTLFNGMSLCPRCNKIKSNYWRYRRSGRAVYVPWPGWANEAAAAAILRRELKHRWNVLRLVRAAWALG